LYLYAHFEASNSIRSSRQDMHNVLWIYGATVSKLESLSEERAVPPHANLSLLVTGCSLYMPQIPLTCAPHFCMSIWNPNKQDTAKPLLLQVKV